MSRPVRSAVAHVLAAAAIATATMLSLAGTAAAQEDPVSGDKRATVHAGNATTCEQAGLAGVDVTAKLTVTKDDTYLDVTAAPADHVLTGVVVKGGPAYNVYLPGVLGTLPWLDLHSPLVSSGKPAAVSHWYACGTKTTTPTSTPSTTTSSPHPSSPASTSTAPGTSAPTGTPSVPVKIPAGDGPQGGGASGGWLVPLGVGVLAASAVAFIAVPRLRRR
ncbi:hypothetical protein EV193_102245 [Herbihabitans rhizosphaerae]|uniref:LPXTG-motif cell wall-anchored protein n=1 Tax=Herbihabitans rhizosphaerae TaxID=1872711 RepID=A0A4Q7L2E5_9PSEU|nr:hypothetical protein [Herbihabitans rhizosphaerae]RZS43266.1 hypothetical protein EV193_102245 [Herbihabitans rhizosphaerae]